MAVKREEGGCALGLGDDVVYSCERDLRCRPNSIHPPSLFLHPDFRCRPNAAFPFLPSRIRRCYKFLWIIQLQIPSSLDLDPAMRAVWLDFRVQSSSRWQGS
jgi:hypothetical protein